MFLTKEDLRKIRNALYYFETVTRDRGDRDKLAGRYHCLAKSIPTQESDLVEAEWLQKKLERAQRAEAEAREATAWEAAIHQRMIVSASDGVGDFLSCMFCGAYCEPDETIKHEADCPIAHPSKSSAALLERLAGLEAQVADLETDLARNAKMMTQQCDQAMMRVAESNNLRSALQAALLPLERAADALMPPGARVEEAAGLVEEALAAIQEELE